MQPLAAGGQLIGFGWEARRDEAGRESTRTSKHDVGKNRQRWPRLEGPRGYGLASPASTCPLCGGGRRWRLRWPRGRRLRWPRLPHGDAESEVSSQCAHVAPFLSQSASASIQRKAPASKEDGTCG